ncbi:MAG: trypsin-like peptidase domain-containing protein [Ruminococcus sp.]|nr:trypsin-like peptidase domain-containing protein [Ruminococcus sp.]
MDEFNNGFNPTDEYQSLDNTPSAKETEKPLVQAEKPVEVETVHDEDDVFSAFEKAEKETPQVVNPMGAGQYRHNTTPMSNVDKPFEPIPQYQPPVVHLNPQTPPPYYPPQYSAPVQQSYPTPPQPPQQYSASPSYRPPYTQAPPVQPNANPYSNATQNNSQPPYNNPYAQQYPIKQKQKTPTGTKVLIGILIGLLIVFMIAFFVSCSKAIKPDDNSAGDNPLAQYGTEPFGGFDEFDDYYGGDYFGNFNFAPQYEGDYFDEDITLQADEGQTQEREEDKDTNTYKPNEKAKGVEFKNIPKDKDNSKYTPQNAYNTVTDSVVSVVCYDGEITGEDEDIMGEGTGTIISSDGYIVTNSHVIGDTKQYTINIVLNNSKEYTAKIVGYDTRTDLAVLKIDAKDLTYAKFCDSSKVEVGQDIITIGNPGGQSFQNSLTKGIVSAVDRELELSSNVSYIQIDAAINPGNSGGPLCNLYGQVIGINTAKISADAYEGMGFAIPSNKVAEIANDLIHYGYVKDRVMLGLMGYEVNEEMIYQYDVPNGILITSISKGGPLDNTDLREYDIITEINGESVSTFQDVFKELEKYEAGEKITITYYRLKY